MPTNNHTTTAPVFNRQNPATWLKPDEPLIGVDGRDWSWAYVWHKDIEGFPGYKIGSDGSVWTCHAPVSKGVRHGGFWQIKSSHWKPMAAARGPWGHRTIGLRRTGQPKGRFRLHVLVMKIFWGPVPPGMVCRHLDGDPSNNDLRNLAFGTPGDNIEDARRHGTLAIGSRHGRSKLTEADIPIIRQLRRDGLEYEEIGRRFGVRPTVASKIFRRKAWAHVPD